mgnify:CR=1 FL=1
MSVERRNGRYDQPSRQSAGIQGHAGFIPEAPRVFLKGCVQVRRYAEANDLGPCFRWTLRLVLFCHTHHIGLTTKKVKCIKSIPKFGALDTKR